MTRSLLDLAERMDEIRLKLPERASKAAVKLAQTILYDLTFTTPVDTSQALSNWQVRINAPIQTAIPPYFPGLRGSTQKVSAQAANQEGLLILNTKRPGEKIVISNVVPYIVRLNDGHSKQQPPGFVQRSIQVGRMTVRKFKLKL